MKTGKNFLVLVPHRDIRLFLRKNSSDLLKIDDICLFPHVAPLAVLCAPLTKDELKLYAHKIRKTIMENKMIAKETAVVPFPVNEEKTFLYGPRLEPLINQDLLIKTENVNKKLTYLFLTQIIGCCLMNDGEKAICAPVELSFRAAAVANMYWKPVKQDGAFGCKWKIGELIWLPKKFDKA